MIITIKYNTECPEKTRIFTNENTETVKDFIENYILSSADTGGLQKYIRSKLESVGDENPNATEYTITIELDPETNVYYTKGISNEAYCIGLVLHVYRYIDTFIIEPMSDILLPEIREELRPKVNTETIYEEEDIEELHQDKNF